MADAPALSDFFAKKSKKKIKATNLNTASTTSKSEEKKSKDKDAEEDEWKEEGIVPTTMNADLPGKLTREEDKKEDEEADKCRWATQKPNKDVSAIKSERDEKRFPTLSVSTKSSNINIGEQETTVNIKTSVNVFAALDGEDSDEEEGPKKPTSIVPARVQKKKGERETAAIEREKEKYGVTGGKKSKKASKDAEGDEEDEDADEAEEDLDEVDEKEEAKAPKKKTGAKKSAKKDADEEDKPKPEEEESEDLKIVPDMVACKEKYKGRKKPFPAKPLPFSEIQEEKENRPKPQVGGGGKKKKKGGFADWDEEDDKKSKMQTVDIWKPSS
mmetsp:Transcript_125695/g.217681  ORF Transcript_125695/g.217681 Transcript_125695/m.217681 type:complete len:329 (-) Transcript_125695:159-1145(-)